MKVIDKEHLIARARPQTIVEESNLKIQVRVTHCVAPSATAKLEIDMSSPFPAAATISWLPVRREEASLAATDAVGSLYDAKQSAIRCNAHDRPRRRSAVEAARRAAFARAAGDGSSAQAEFGKTTVAFAVAERMIASYKHGVWLVDLAPLADPSLVPSTVATVLGLEIRTGNALPDLVAWLRDRQTLLVFDNCEHIIDAVAGLTAAILSGAPGVSILATSREPLGMAGEGEYRLTPLAIPKASSSLNSCGGSFFPRGAVVRRARDRERRRFPVLNR